MQVLGGRKFVLSMVITLTCTALVWFDKISPGVFQYVIIATAGAYLTSNVAQKAVIKEGTKDGSTS
jgi:hypothetical protein